MAIYIVVTYFKRKYIFVLEKNCPSRPANNLANQKTVYFVTLPGLAAGCRVPGPGPRDTRGVECPQRSLVKILCCEDVVLVASSTADSIHHNY